MERIDKPESPKQSGGGLVIVILLVIVVIGIYLFIKDEPAEGTPLKIEAPTYPNTYESKQECESFPEGCKG